MPLVASSLASGIEALEPTESEADAIQRFVEAWDSYFSGASVSGVPVNAGTYATGLSAMASALVGWSAQNAAASAIQAAVNDFWSTIAPLGAAMWTLPPPAVVTPPLVPPTGISGIGAALEALFLTLAADEATLGEAASQMADVIHAAGGIGGIAPVTIPPAGPVSTPIL